MGLTFNLSACVQEKYHAVYIKLGSEHSGRIILRAAKDTTVDQVDPRPSYDQIFFICLFVNRFSKFLLHILRQTRCSIVDWDVKHQLSRLMGKPTICIGENKDADQLRGNREADQHLCFRYSDSTITPLLKSEISSF